MDFKKVFLILLVGMFLITFVSADWNDIKTFNKDKSNFGEIKIKDWLGIANKADYTLLKYDCSVINCYAEGEYILHKKTELFSDLFFKDTLGTRGSFEEVKLFIWRERSITETKEITEEQYNKEKGYNEVIIIDYVNETKVKGEWVLYEKGTDLESSEGKWRFEAKRKANKKIDFILEAHGKEFEEWAWFNNTWDYRRTISNLTANLSYMNISYIANMNSDFSDLRFTGSDETTELNYTIETSVASTYAIVRVMNLESSIYMYYSNTSAVTTTSDASATYLDPIALYFMASTTDSSGNGYTLSASGSPSLVSGRLGQGYNLTGTQYLTSGAFSVANHTMFISLKSICWTNAFCAGDAQTTLSRSAGGDVLELAGRGDTGMNYYAYDGSSYARAVDGTNRTPSSWYDYVGRFNDATNNVTIYYRGVAINSTTQTGTMTEASTATYIGRSSLGAFNYFRGTLDEAYIYDRPLTDAEIYIFGTTNEPSYVLGAEEENTQIQITLHYPIVSANLTTSNSLFNATIVSGFSVVNVTLLVDDIIIQTNTSGLNNTVYELTASALTNGAHNWSIQVWNTNGYGDSETRTFNISITAPAVTLQSPVTQYNTTSQTNSFIGFLTSPDNLANVSLAQNGTTITATTNMTGLNNTNYTFSGTFPEGSHTWNVIACDIQNDCGSGTTRTINIDSSSPTINITLPTGVSSYAESGQNETLNWTILDTNLNSCWYEYGGVNTSVTCSANTTIFTLGSGRTINFWANDTFGNLAGSSRTWSYTLFLNSITYASEVYETSTATHILNLSYDTSTLAVTAILEYDNINYSTTKAVETNGAVFTREFDIPIGGVTGSKNFTWFMEVTEGVTQNSSTRQYNQTINEIYLGLCNVNQTIAGVNFTYYDEDLGTIINGTNAPTNFEGTFRYWVGSGDTYKNYSISNLSVSNVTYEFCINPSNNSIYQIHTDLDLIIGADGYNPNSYYLRNATLTNNTNYINLYLLNESIGQKFFFTSYVGVTPLADATITITKYFEGEGVYKAVGIANTDSSGAFTQYLELDKSYQFSAVQDGEYIGVVEKTSICTSAPCELTLQYNEGGESPFAGYFEVIAESVTGSLYFNQTTKMVMSSFTDITGTANYFRLLVSRTSLNETSLIVCDTTSYTTAGAITCNMTGYVGNFEAKLLISRSPEKIVELINFVTGSIQENLGTIALIVSAILLIIITFAGLRNPVIAVIGVPVALTALKIMDFLPLSWLFIGGITAVALFLIGRLKT